MKLCRQQAVSALTNLNSTTFAEDGAEWTKFGVEYWSDPSSRSDGFVEWVADQPVFRIDANVLGPDPTVNISQRLITEEPMSIILNLAISGEFFTSRYHWLKEEWSRALMVGLRYCYCVVQSLSKRSIWRR